MVIHTTTKDKIYGLDLFIGVNVEEDFLDPLTNILNIGNSLTYDSGTEKFTFTYSDTTGTMKEGCLRVTLVKAKEIVVCDQCINSTAASLECDTSAYATGKFFAMGSVSSSPYFFPIATMEEEKGTLAYSVWGTTGVVLAFFLVGTVSLIGGSLVGMVLGTVAFIGSAFIGFIYLSKVSGFVIIIIAGIILYNLRKS